MQTRSAQLILIVTASLTPLMTLGDEIDRPKQFILVVIGAPGEADYDETFHSWAASWRAAAEATDAGFAVIGDSNSDSTDRDLIATALRKQAEVACDRFWLVLIGHGTYDGHAAKFNLRGPDITAQGLADELEPIASPTVVINCASSSGPFINQLRADGRIVITATKSGYEINFARFGQFLVEAIQDRRADLDKDDQVSLLEAYLTACRRVAEFYDRDARLASEHALLDDNGDGLGTPASWFRGLRATEQAKEGAALDGTRAHQVHLIISDREARMPSDLRKCRDALELELAELRERKPEMSEDAYFRELESLLLQLARIYQAVDAS